MEIAHNTILELKSAAGLAACDESQLMKYVRDKQICGMHVEHAAVVCFRYDGVVEIREVDVKPHPLGQASESSLENNDG
jgi:hypothetical protein